MHNSYFAQLLKKRGYDPAVYFQGSVQLDGGLVSVTNKIMNALTETKDAKETKQNKTKETWCPNFLPVLSSGLTIGLVRVGNVNDSPYLGSDDQGVKAVAARLASNLLTACLSRGVNVVVPTSSGLYQNAEFLDTVLEISTGAAGLAFGQTLPKEEESQAGKLYVMDARGVDDAVELVTGLAASGCHSIVMFSERKFVPQHEMVPITVVSCCGSKDEKVTVKEIVEAMRLAHGKHSRGDIPISAFQISRGLLSVSV